MSEEEQDTNQAEGNDKPRMSLEADGGPVKCGTMTMMRIANQKMTHGGMTTLSVHCSEGFQMMPSILLSEARAPPPHLL